MRAVIVEAAPTAADAAPGSTLYLVCPWLGGLPAESGLWVSALPIHDANAFVDDAAPIAVPPVLAPYVYFGVFLLDPFRASGALFQRLRERGVARLVNLPSVSFFDGQTAATLASLDFGPAQEQAALLEAKRHGLGVGLCGRRAYAPADAGAIDFVLWHDGPGQPLELDWRGAASRHPDGGQSSQG